MPCPAASVHPPAVGDGVPTVLCGVLANSNEGAHIAGVTRRGQVDPVFHGDRDPSIVRFTCLSPGVPGSRMSYCACVLWRAQRDADRAGRRGPDALRDEQATRPRNRTGHAPPVADALTALEG